MAWSCIMHVYLMNVKLSYTMFTVSYICSKCISVDSMEDLSCTELGNKKKKKKKCSTREGYGSGEGYG